MKDLPYVLFVILIVGAGLMIGPVCFDYDVKVWYSVITGMKLAPLPLIVIVVGGILLSEIAVPLAIITWLCVGCHLIHPLM